jgi:DNA-binding beta-propeller fold protein YncE
MGAALSLAVGVTVAGVARAAPPAGEPSLVATIGMPDVHGRIDHLAIDPAGDRLFVAALGNDTLEVLDLSAGVRQRTIAGLHEPQGVLFLPERHELYVTNGGGGVCDVFDADTLARRHAIALGDDADNLRWDGGGAIVYVGEGSGALSLIDPSGAAVVGRIALPVHPESFQLERAGPRIFVNLPGARRIAVVDRERRAVVATWPLVEARANYPMALDEARRRLFVGLRQPARLDVYDIDAGTRIATVPIVGDVDDLFVDARNGRVYAIGGEGRVDILAAEGGTYRRAAQIETRAGARTGLWVAESNRLYVALPRTGPHPAEVRVYDIPP